MHGRARHPEDAAPLLELQRLRLLHQSGHVEVGREVVLQERLQDPDQRHERARPHDDLDQGMQPDPVGDAIGGHQHDARDGEVEQDRPVGAVGLDARQRAAEPDRERHDRRGHEHEDGPADRLRTGEDQVVREPDQEPPHEQYEADDQRRPADVGRAGQDQSGRNDREEHDHEAQHQNRVGAGGPAPRGVGLPRHARRFEIRSDQECAGHVLGPSVRGVRIGDPGRRCAGIRTSGAARWSCRAPGPAPGVAAPPRWSGRRPRTMTSASR